jgi:hypothetical protein
MTCLTLLPPPSSSIISIAFRSFLWASPYSIICCISPFDGKTVLNLFCSISGTAHDMGVQRKENAQTWEWKRMENSDTQAIIFVIVALLYNVTLLSILNNARHVQCSRFATDTASRSRYPPSVSPSCPAGDVYITNRNYVISTHLVSGCRSTTEMHRGSCLLVSYLHTFVHLIFEESATKNLVYLYVEVCKYESTIYMWVDVDKHF